MELYAKSEIGLYIPAQQLNGAPELREEEKNTHRAIRRSLGCDSHTPCVVFIFHVLARAV